MHQVFIQPSIEVLNIRIDEPITTATDLLLAAVCFFAFFRIRKLESTQRIKWYFKYYFLTLGFGTLFGGLLGHAFLYKISPYWKLVSWILILISVACIVHALVELSKPLVRPAFTRFASVMNLLVLTLAIIITVWTLAFSAVKVYTIFGMFIVVGTLSYYIFHKTRSRGASRFLIALAVALLTAFIVSFEWGLSPWFNHNDISHVILCFSALIIYKGASLILEAPASIL